MIELNQVGIGYQKEILRTNDIFLESGKVYALVGRNGIGKSTFIQTIIGQQIVLSGDILIDQRSISTFSTKELSETIALVETRFEGVEYLTVKDYLALGRAPFTDAYGRMTSVDWEIVQKTAADLSAWVKSWPARPLNMGAKKPPIRPCAPLPKCWGLAMKPNFWRA